MIPPMPPSAAAGLGMRRWCERRARVDRGEMLCRVVVDGEMFDLLIFFNELNPDHGGDREAVSAAVGRLLRRSRRAAQGGAKKIVTSGASGLCKGVRMVRPISLRLRASEVNRDARATLERLRRVEVVDARIKVLEAERKKLLARRGLHVQRRADQQLLVRLFAGYSDGQSRVELDKAALKARAAASVVRALDMLLRLNKDDLRRLAAHREGLSNLRDTRMKK
jgi:hypothetical protein